MQDFLATNRSYVSDQSEVIAGYGELIRSGLSVSETQRDMNRALDLASLKHISVADAVQLLVLAEHGRTRGLIDLGITTTKYTDAEGNVINQGKNMALVMKEIDEKTAHGRETQTQMTQATNRLSNDWQDLANNVGPQLISLFDGLIRGADWLWKKLTELGANKDWNDALYTGFGKVQDAIMAVTDQLEGFIGDIKWLIDRGGDIKNFLTPSGAGARSGAPTYGHQHGGPVYAGGTYTVGERGPETLYMGAGSGYVSPSAGTGGGGTSIHIHVDRGAFIDGPSVDRLANVIAQRLSYATGR